MTDVKLRWPEDYIDQVVIADVLDGLRGIPNGVIQTCITSPPYWGLRDYKADGQLGLEKTPEEYVAKMVEVFREVRRVLKDDGTLWLNLGDSYASTGRSDRNESPGVGAKQSMKRPGRTVKWKAGGGSNFSWQLPGGIKPKDLVGIPWRVAFALQADGWYLRSDIIWSKPNPMPESVTDRPTKAHEYLFLMSKNAKYYYDADAIREPNSENSDKWGRMVPTKTAKAQGKHGETSALTANLSRQECIEKYYTNGRNKRSVWEIPTAPYPEAHFATFPPALVNPCILAGTSEKGNCPECGAAWVRQIEKTKYEPPVVDIGARNVDPSRGDKTRKLSGKEYNEQVYQRTLGWQPSCSCGREPEPAIVLDPFGGSGTTAWRAKEMGRRFVHIDLAYQDLAEKRLRQEVLF